MARPRKPILTEWETKVMRIVWQQEHVTADEIREILRSRRIRRSDSAIRTTLRALEKKGAITHTVENRTFIYTPKLSRDQAEKDVIQYLKKVFFPESPGTFAIRVLEETDHIPPQEHQRSGAEDPFTLAPQPTHLKD